MRREINPLKAVEPEHVPLRLWEKTRWWAAALWKEAEKVFLRNKSKVFRSVKLWKRKPQQADPKLYSKHSKKLSKWWIKYPVMLLFKLIFITDWNHRTVSSFLTFHINSWLCFIPKQEEHFSVWAAMWQAGEHLPAARAARGQKIPPDIQTRWSYGEEKGQSPLCKARRSTVAANHTNDASHVFCHAHRPQRGEREKRGWVFCWWKAAARTETSCWLRPGLCGNTAAGFYCRDLKILKHSNYQDCFGF